VPAEKIAAEWITVPIDGLRPHPRNYRTHPEEQLAHIRRSLELHGFYRNVVVARDHTILAGHGVVEAARSLGRSEIPVRRLDVGPDDVAAIQVLTGDNEMGNLAGVDDRELTELLRELMVDDVDNLLSTGFDPQQLAALLLTTRTADEIPDSNAAGEWVGMPEFLVGDTPWKIIVSFTSEEDRQRFVDEYGFDLRYKTDKRAWSMLWPDVERRDLASVKYG
jgi:hypothetical protein